MLPSSRVAPSFRVLTTLCILTTLVSGCSSELAHLSYDQALSLATKELYKTRDSHPGLTALSLVCDTATGPLRVEVAYTEYGSFFNTKHIKTYQSPTKCNEVGLLVFAQYKYRDGFNVKSKHAYSPALVVPEFEKALDKVYGQLTLNKDMTANLKGSLTQQLSDMGIREIEFICDSRNKVVLAGAAVRGVYQEAPTKLACSISDANLTQTHHAPMVAKVAFIGEERPPFEATSNQKEKPVEYQMLTSESVSVAEGMQLVENFLSKNTQKKTF